MNENTVGFLHHCRHMVDFWNRTAVSTSPKQALEGLAFSILTALDGMALACKPPSQSDMGRLHDYFSDLLDDEPQAATVTPVEEWPEDEAAIERRQASQCVRVLRHVLSELDEDGVYALSGVYFPHGTVYVARPVEVVKRTAKLIVFQCPGDNRNRHLPRQRIETGQRVTLNNDRWEREYVIGRVVRPVLEHELEGAEEWLRRLDEKAA